MKVPLAFSLSLFFLITFLRGHAFSILVRLVVVREWEETKNSSRRITIE